MTRARCAAMFCTMVACATTPGSFGTPERDGGATRDGGASLDGGAAADDGGGVTQDGGAGSVDGGVGVDGGTSTQDGGSSDGGATDGGAADGGGTDGGACAPVTVTLGTTSAGIDCDATINEAAVRAQVCSGTRVAAGLYDEATGTRTIEWETEGDGSGHTIFACRDTVTEARDLLMAGRLADFTGCEAETDDYFSFEATLPGSSDRFFLRVDKCSRWPYIRDSLSTISGMQIGQVGPPGITVDAALAAHVAQYLWFTERDFRSDFYLLGGRPVTGPPLGHALCEAERSGASIILRKVTFTVDTVGRNIVRTEQAKSTIPGC